MLPNNGSPDRTGAGSGHICFAPWPSPRGQAVQAAGCPLRFAPPPSPFTLRVLRGYFAGTSRGYLSGTMCYTKPRHWAAQGH